MLPAPHHNHDEVIKMLHIALDDEDTFQCTSLRLGIRLYHAQQAAEKLLKAYLLHSNGHYSHTHALDTLLMSCARIDPEFIHLSEGAEIVNAMSTKYRYPTDQRPTQEEIEISHQFLSNLKAGVCRLLQLNDQDLLREAEAEPDTLLSRLRPK